MTSDPPLGSGGLGPRRAVVLPCGQVDQVPVIPGLDVVAELGRGGDSVVYHVRRGDHDYALKVLGRSPGHEGPR